jgi:hypothetical protein
VNHVRGDIDGINVQHQNSILFLSPQRRTEQDCAN